MPVLLGMGVLTVADGFALARYCRFWVRWRRCEAAIDDPATDPRAVRLLAVRAERLAKALGDFEDRFGMTPAARARVRVEARPKTDEHKARYFGGGADDDPPDL